MKQIVENGKTYVIRQGKRIEVVARAEDVVPAMKRIVENGKTYIVRNGQRIEIKTKETDTPPKRRKPFKAEWVKLPQRWIETLRYAKSLNTYHLALALLAEAFKRQHIGGDIVLSSTVTGMPRNTKLRAARELVELGLIILHQREGNRACKVGLLSTENKEE